MFERDIYNQLQKWAERTGRKPGVAWCASGRKNDVS